MGWMGWVGWGWGKSGRGKRGVGKGLDDNDDRWMDALANGVFLPFCWRGSFLR